MIKECTAYEELFAAWLDGKLSLPEKITLQDHIEECPTCHNEILAMKRHWDAVDLLTAPAVHTARQPRFSFRFIQLLRRIRESIWPPSSRSGHGSDGCL